MGKRLIVLLIALVMVVSGIPASAIAAFAAETVPANVIHADYGTVMMDGELSETEWSLVGDLADGVSFGAVYDANSLYLGIAGKVSDLKVKMNGADATVTQKDGSAHELQISLEQVGLDLYKHDQTVSLEITAGETTWTGTICFGSATLGSRVEKFNNNDKTLKDTTSSVYSDGAFTGTLDSSA